MKQTVLLFIAFLTVSLATAQENDDFRWHYSFGAVINPDFNINDNLRAAGRHRLPDAMPSFGLGWSAETNRLAVDFDFVLAGVLNSKKDKGFNFLQAPIVLKVHYVMVDKPKFSFSGGLSATYLFNDLAIYSDDTEVDMNDLDPDNNTGYIRLNNQSFFIGPSLSFKFLKHTANPLKVTMGYDFALTNSKWKSDYASISNSVKENGGRGFIQLTIPFGTVGRMFRDTTPAPAPTPAE